MKRLALAAAAALFLSAPAAAQLGDLVSPGPLSAPHAKLDGLKNCEKCHEQGNRVSAQRCLACHKDVASRIAQKKGVHRDLKKECAACHADHSGRDGELRPFETKGFDHANEAGFPLDGKHAPLAEKCASCHKTRSFLKLSPSCVTCHADSHKGALGPSCITCHSAAVAFKETRQSFDHGKTKYPLTGAHVKVACAKCHANGVFRGVKFATCADCHKDPHQKAFGADCSSCHETATFRTVKVDHGKTAFPLRGRHAEIQCAACHKEPATKVKLKAGTCATCHQDPHRGEFKQDCASCHNEKAFRGAPFDHAVKTKFALTGKHATAKCAACHVPPGVAAAGANGKKSGGKGVAKANGSLPKVVVFKGLKTECAACHKDPHKGTLGTACGTCHGTESFRPKDFKHPRFPEFFAGLHQNLACEKCHGGAKTGPNGKPVAIGDRTYRGLATACATCHKDPHLGQVSASCETCHAVSGAKFAPVKFDHAKSAFPLAGKHAPLACEKCHKKETAKFPAATGTAVRLKGLGTACATCHKDPHLGQLGTSCATCHSPETFKVPTFKHPGSPEFWKGAHATTPCAKCHKTEAGSFPAGKGTAVRYKGFKSSCASCHKDAHQGTLGPSCESCHVPSAQWKNASRAFHKTSWPLEGKHLLVPCASCHVKGQTKGTPRLCADCHWFRRQDDRFKTRLGLDCQNCHRPASWTAVTWSHAAATGFALSGAHAGVDCEKCHTGGVFRKSERSGCLDCHKEDYDRAEEPNHVTAGFPTTCETCHKVSDTSWEQARFNHQASFPLAGKHATADCASCHKNGIYRGTARDCSGCHLTLYQKATNPSHILAGFPTTCESCHRSSDPTWKGVSFTHPQWPLVGQHAGQACTTCHRNGVFQGLGSTCASCHQADYQKAANPNHASAGFPTACETCHKVSDTSWQQGKFDHATTFPLVGKHTTQACVACHASGVYRGTARDCVGCHLPLFQKATNPSHILAGFPTTCETCHKATDPAWTGVTFDHSKWPLAGKHSAQACTACHRSGVFQGLPSTCASCHQSDYQKAVNPNHVTAGFPTTCESCHKVSDASWTQGTFNHSKWPLLGRHSGPLCATCHKNGVFQGLQSDCVACHLPQYETTKDPNHVQAAFPTTCQVCHKVSDTSWGQGTFNHATVFPLVGTHATQACASCHKNGVYKGTARDCVGCHLAKYQGAKDPNHVQAGFPTTCETCHKATDTSWGQGTFNHATVFPLVGTHATQECASCHKNGVYKGTARDCVGCHLAKYQGAKDPNHVQAGFPTTCETCHKGTDTSWDQGTFNHATVFPLVGTHATQACASCHKNGVYGGTPRTCVGCHLGKYQSTTNPNHAAAGFPTTCETCHKGTDTSWGQGTFNHGAVFPLQGRHATAACASCHVNGVYGGTPRTCVGCHLPKYQATTNPNHQAAGFPTTCETCHKATDTSWGQGTFNHAAVFPLQGQHATAPCAACHINGVYGGTPRTCVGCHLGKYQATTNPNHVAAGFPTTCETCHKATDTSWGQGTFNHAAVFPLQGQHATAPCASCHINGVYGGTPRTCVGCHLGKYQATTNPNHVAAGFPTTCETCHRATDTSWGQGTFNHAAVFPLQGQHATAPCAACHINGVYGGTPRTCVGCHLAEYQATTNPNHQAAGFPTTCETCHKATDTSWGQGTFNHTWFPITTGKHAGNPCSACHTNPSNYAIFTCITCHGRTETDKDHRGVTGYRYESPACYACHPQGQD